MNGTRASLTELFEISGENHGEAEVIICPPFTLLHEAITAAMGTDVQIGGQNCHQELSGAFTGEVSAAMLSDLGATHVIVGHSERREYFGETSEIVAQKANRAIEAGLTAIICVGETLAEREAGNALKVVEAQIKASIPKSANTQNTIIAYEPVWAIGTGKVPSNDDIAQMHAHIRRLIPDANAMRVLYGGSVKGSNAKEIFAIENVDGGLVGGASLTAKDFIPIIQAAKELN